MRFIGGPAHGKDYQVDKFRFEVTTLDAPASMVRHEALPSASVRVSTVHYVRASVTLSSQNWNYIEDVMVPEGQSYEQTRRLLRQMLPPWAG